MQRTDEEITHDITEELKWDPGLDATNIAVAVKSGIVTLAGTVESHVDKYEAEQTAKRIAGVLAVVNDIEVRLPVLDRRALPGSAGNIRATVSDGWITLEGTAESVRQRQAAEKAVRRIKGVKGVSNLVRVKSPAQPDPETVKRKIEEALKRSAEIRANRIQVETKNGTVVLKGTVRSWIEREEAERAAWAAPGVADVEDRIVVSP